MGYGTAASASVAALQLFYNEDGTVQWLKDGQALADAAAGSAAPRAPYLFKVLPGHRGERVDPLGGRFTVQYDEKGRAARFIDEIGRTVTQAFDAEGRVSERVFPEGDKSLFEYDDRSNVIKFTRVAKPASGLAALVAEAAYDPSFNKPLWVRDFKGNVTNLSYGASGGARGQVIEALRPAVAGVRPQYNFSYAADGQPLDSTAKIDGAAALVTRNVYHATNGNLIGVTIDPAGLNLRTCFEYDAVGNRTAVIDPRAGCAAGATGATTPFRTVSQYDAMRRPTAVTDPLGKTARTFYDANGRAIRSTVQIGTQWQTSCTAYTPTGRTAKTWGPALTASDTACPSDLAAAVAVTDLSYDALDRLDIETRRLAAGEGADRRTKTVYDAAGQVTRVIRAYGAPLQQDYQTYSYTPNGQQASVRDANGNLTSYEYDGFDRLIAWFFPSKTTPGASSATDVERYQYDANGNRTSLTKRDGQLLAFSYDALDRLILRDLPGAADDVTYAYDLLGRQTAVTIPGHAIANAYDTAGRLKSTTAGGRTLSYLYDAASNRTRVTHPDGVYFTYDHDALNRVTAVKENGAAALATYAYDDLSRRTVVSLGNGTTTSYGYETDGALDSLTNNMAGTAQDVTFGFDYNRVNQIAFKTASTPLYDWTALFDKTVASSHNGLNQVTAVGAATISHDANGNLTGDGVWAYSYDAENRLRTAAKSGVSASYSYDGLGRRISKTGAGVAATWYLTDGDAMVAEYAASTGTAPLRRYVHGPGVDEPIVVYDGAGTASKRWFYTNWQGSIIAEANTAGAVTATYRYGPYGEPDALTGAMFRYTGQLLDAETGLYYYKARYYSPQLGRFLQTDPIGYQDDQNLYAYVGGDPVNNTDPTGEECHSTNTNCPGSGFDAGKEFAGAAEGLQRTNNQLDLARSLPDPARTAAEVVAVGTGVAIAGAVAIETVGVAEAAELAVTVSDLVDGARSIGANLAGDFTHVASEDGISRAAGELTTETSEILGRNPDGTRNERSLPQRRPSAKPLLRTGRANLLSKTADFLDEIKQIMDQ